MIKIMFFKHTIRTTLQWYTRAQGVIPTYNLVKNETGDFYIFSRHSKYVEYLLLSVNAHRILYRNMSTAEPYYLRLGWDRY
jgi:hypothetical protein